MANPRVLNRERNIWRGEATRIPGLRMFGHYHYLAARSGLARHQHEDALEICYLARGEQTYRVGKEIYRLRGGDQFVTFPDEWHDTAGEPQQKGELYWIILQNAALPENALQLQPVLSRELLRGLNRLPARRFRAAPGAAEWLIKIETALLGKKSGRGQLVAAFALHQYLLATIQAAAEALEKAPRRRVRESMDWMEAHLDEPARIREVAEAVGWSEAHLKAAFRKETGQTPHDYFLRRKVAKARHLLAVEKRAVTEVALTLGFSSSQHFATAFRKFTGQTPSSARM